MAFGAQLTAPEQAKMQGPWIVSAAGTNRLYEFSPGLNVKISGDGLKDRRGHLTQLSDGAFLIKLDGDELLRFTYTPATDQLTVEFFKNKKDMEKGLPAHWKATAQRRP